MSFSAAQLQAVVQQYWRQDKDFDFRPETSPEAERFMARWDQELAKMDQWRAFTRDLEGLLPDFDIGNATATCDACFRCSVYPKEGTPQSRSWVVVGCVSILAPVYTVYGVQYGYRDGMRITERVLIGPLPPQMQVPADIVSGRIEATFGISALPRELAEVPVSLIVEPKEPPQTTLFHALFISRPERVP